MMDTIWQTVKSQIKAQIPGHSYRMWIDPLDVAERPDGTLVLTCPNQFYRKRVRDHYLEMIRTLAAASTGKACRIDIEVCEKPERPRRVNGHSIQLALPQVSVRPHMGRLLRKNFTFDQFVVGKNNDFAYCAVLSLASKSRQTQNTLFLLSKTGLGKSHLSQAAGHFILQKHPSDRVYYITAEDFTNEMVQAFRHGAVDAFKRKYRDGCDVLLMEDVHYLSGKERTQVELGLALEFLIESNKKIIFSSCFLPNEIPKLDDKLRSCLSSGLISSIEPPDFGTRVRILKQKCRLNGHEVPKEIIDYLASELTQDVRQLESGLIGVTARSSLLGAPIDMRLAENVVRHIAGVRKSITVDAIKRLVCDQYQVSVKDIVSRSRKQCFVRPRQIAIYLSRRYTDSSLQAIGQSFNRYHATALHSIAAVEKEMKENIATRSQVKILCSKLESGNF